MKIAYFGSSSFGLPVLEALCKGHGHDIVCCVTQPDRKKGRGLVMGMTAIKEFAVRAAIPVFQPKDINSPDSVQFLQGLNADIFIVISYGQILSERLLGMCRLPAINAHASLLPRYRGAAPIHWAVCRGEARTGVTVMKMAKRMDAGPILLQKEIPIQPEDTASALEEKLSLLARDAVMETLGPLDKGTQTFTEQDESMATYAPKLKKQDGLIPWQLPSQEVYNLIRAFCDTPGAWTTWRQKMVKVHACRICDSAACPAPGRNKVPGEVIAASKEGILVACGNGSLVINSLQPEGRTVMTAAGFLSGHKLQPGDILKD